MPLPQASPLFPRRSDSSPARLSCAAARSGRWPAGYDRGRLLLERANSEVWKAWDRHGQPCEVVLLASDASALERERFADGARTLERLRGTPGLGHIVEVDGHGVWYAREPAPSVALENIDVNRWQLGELIELFGQIADVIAALHSSVANHGCLCIRNVYVDERRRALLREVGMVDVSLLDGRERGLAEDYAACAAPEVIRGESFDSRADVYSLGRVLQFLAAGYLLEPGEHVELAFGRHLEHAAPLALVVRRATSELACERYGSVEEMQRELTQALSTRAAVEDAASPELPQPVPPAPRPLVDSERQEQVRVSGTRSRRRSAMPVDARVAPDESSSRDGSTTLPPSGVRGEPVALPAARERPSLTESLRWRHDVRVGKIELVLAVVVLAVFAAVTAWFVG